MQYTYSSFVFPLISRWYFLEMIARDRLANWRKEAKEVIKTDGIVYPLEYLEKLVFSLWEIVSKTPRWILLHSCFCKLSVTPKCVKIHGFTKWQSIENREDSRWWNGAGSRDVFSRDWQPNFEGPIQAGQSGNEILKSRCGRCSIVCVIITEQANNSRNNNDRELKFENQFIHCGLKLLPR